MNFLNLKSALINLILQIPILPSFLF